MSKRSNKQVFKRLSEILAAHSRRRVNGRQASERTIASYTEVLNMCFDQLHELGYRIQNPENLNETHVKALCQHWHATEKSPSTMQEYLSKLRVFSKWVGKGSMVKSLTVYLPDVDPSTLKASRIAKKSKSWTENDVDISLKISEADAVDTRFGLIVRMMLAFGLRRKEVLLMKPHRADFGNLLRVFPGEAKGGRPRDIYLDNPEQRQLLDMVKKFLRKGESLAWPETRRGKPADFKYCQRHYHALLEKIGITKLESGVTGHGCRAQYAENAMLIMGVIPPTLGGTSGQMERDTLDMRREQLSEQVGHSRKDVTTAYFGSFGRDTKEEEADRCRKNIMAAMPYVSTLLPVPDERREDCLQLVGELEMLDIEVTIRQAYTLWLTHSERFVTAWAKPRKGNAEALEAAALTITKRASKK